MVGAKEPEKITKLPLTHLTRYANQGKQFMHCTVTGNETWVNHATSETKESFHDVEIPSIASIKEIQSNTISKKRNGNCLCCKKGDHKGMLHVYFLARGDTVTAERYCGTNLPIIKFPLCLSNLYQLQRCVTRTL
jgi:hypothetical protein